MNIPVAWITTVRKITRRSRHMNSVVEYLALVWRPIMGGVNSAAEAEISNQMNSGQSVGVLKPGRIDPFDDPSQDLKEST
jgi:hypothetical protein